MYLGEGFMKKEVALPIGLLSVLLLALVATGGFDTVHAFTEVNGIIGSSTTWTKANSPYNLTANVLIDDGVTITVETGATVNCNEYYIRVNGSLILEPEATINLGVGYLTVNGMLVARGTSLNRVNINGTYKSRLPVFASEAHNSHISFSATSKNWNEQTESGSIIENANIVSTSLDFGSSPLIKGNNFSGEYADDIISSTETSSVFSLNSFRANGRIFISGQHPMFSSNTVIGDYQSVYAAGTAEIANNTISGGMYGVVVASADSGTSSPWIHDNFITNCTFGVQLSYGNEALIERNEITDNIDGINFEYSSPTNVTIQNNTIARNTIGINHPTATTTIRYNNIENNTENSIHMGISSDFDATYNWWGTTDTQAINQTFYDFKNDFDLGNVNFIPFLTEPNTQALPDVNLIPAPTPTYSPSTSPSASPSPSQNPTPTPSSTPATPQPDLNGTVIAILVAIIAALLIVIAALVLRKKR